MTLKVNRTDTDQLATYDFLLVIHNYGPIMFYFQAKWQCWLQYPLEQTYPCLHLSQKKTFIASQ